MRTSFGAGPTPGAGLAGASSSSWRRRWRCTRARSSAWTCHHSCSAVWMSGSAWWSRCHGAVCAQGTGILRGRLFCKSAPGADEIGTDRVAGAVAAGRCCPHLWRWRSRHAQRRPRREPLGPLGVAGRGPGAAPTGRDTPGRAAAAYRSSSSRSSSRDPAGPDCYGAVIGVLTGGLTHGGGRAAAPAARQTRAGRSSGRSSGSTGACWTLQRPLQRLLRRWRRPLQVRGCGMRTRRGLCG